MTQNTYKRTERLTPYTGANFDDFSKLMYEYKNRANKGFTFIDIDCIIRNYEKQTIAIIEVKTRNGLLTYAQQKAFNEMDLFLSRGVCCGWVYIGFYRIVFESTSFESGKCWINGIETSKEQYLTFLDNHF